MGMIVSRYQIPVGAEIETQPGSHGRVLRNRLGITRKSEMDQAEYRALIDVQQRYLLDISASTRFDAALIRRMHRDWLGAFMIGRGSIVP